MPKIPAKVAARLQDGLKKFQPIISSAASRDVNESDTSMIVTDMLSDLFGYDKYSEITREFAIRGTYCDLAIKLNEKPRVLIEVKAVGVALKDQHTKQAVDYAANLGLEWVLLTNAVTWKVYKVIFAQPVDSKEILSFDCQTLNARAAGSTENLFMLAKEGFVTSALDDFYTQKEAVNKFTVAALLTTEAVVKTVRKELQRVYPEIKIQTGEIEHILLNDVMKREVTEGDEVKGAAKKISRALSKLAKKKGIQSSVTNASGDEVKPEPSDIVQ